MTPTSMPWSTRPWPTTAMSTGDFNQRRNDHLLEVGFRSRFWFRNQLTQS